ncbi:hypothetical protein FRB99_007682 [Tulasnella sp. 403]|nr:hypothetical protein FRB99_007682 [Tulasnella sp. 403]
MGLCSDRRRHSGFYSRGTTINILRFFWIFLVVWCELGAFFWSLSPCRWPDRAFKYIDKTADPSHVLILADPHFKDSRLTRRSTWLRSFTEFFVHLNLRKSWNAVSRLNPHLVIVLGDMLEDGRAVMTDNEQVTYDSYANRFRATFKLSPRIQFHYITGNHDVGLGSHRAFSGQARRRFRQNFGPEQQVFEFANHTFVAIDAPALVDEDYRRHAAEVDFDSWQGTKAGPIAFVKSLRNNPPNKPTILLSHVPLARPDTALCGPHRERAKGIRRGAGYGFQNLLGKDTTHFILQSLKPVLVFSADDHDYCDYVHRSVDGDVREVTVRTFAMDEDIRRPGFHLLSLYTPPSTTTLPRRADLPCLLPDQFRTYTFIYLPFFLLSIAYVAYINWSLVVPRSIRVPRELQPLRVPSTFNEPTTPTHLSVRRTASFQNFSTLSPRLSSRPSSPMIPPAVLFDEEDMVVPPLNPIILPSPIIQSPLIPFTAEPEDDAPPYTPNGTPRQSAIKRYLKGDDVQHGWRRLVHRALDAVYLWKSTPSRPSRLAAANSAGRINRERLAWRILTDILHIAWPSALVAAFVWWRLFSW